MTTKGILHDLVLPRAGPLLTGREDGAIESSRHWLTCTAHSELQAGLDPEFNVDHRVVFLRRVQLHRIQLEKELI